MDKIHLMEEFVGCYENESNKISYLPEKLLVSQQKEHPL